MFIKLEVDNHIIYLNVFHIIAVEAVNGVNDVTIIKTTSERSYTTHTAIEDVLGWIEKALENL